MHEAGMHTWTDDMANVHGRIRGQNSTAPLLVLGSHYDTVKDAGKFDGALGILVGIAAVKASVVEVTLSFALQVFSVAFDKRVRHIWILQSTTR